MALYLRAMGDHNGVVGCEIESDPGDSAALLRACAATWPGLVDVPEDQADKFAAAVVAVPGTGIDPTGSWLPDSVVTWPDGNPFDAVVEPGRQVAFYLKYAEGWRVELAITTS